MQQRRDGGVVVSLISTLALSQTRGERQSETDVAISAREDSGRDGKMGREETERKGRAGEGSRAVKSNWRLFARP